MRTANKKASTQIDFDQVNRATLTILPILLRRWLPDGRACGREWTARNPTRVDHHPGSFRINMSSGRWADFASGHQGGDPVSLAAYLFNLSQAEAAQRLAEMTKSGVNHDRPVRY